MDAESMLHAVHETDRKHVPAWHVHKYACAVASNSQNSYMYILGFMSHRRFEILRTVTLIENYIFSKRGNVVLTSDSQRMLNFCWWRWLIHIIIMYDFKHVKMSFNRVHINAPDGECQGWERTATKSTYLHFENLTCMFYNIPYYIYDNFFYNYPNLFWFWKCIKQV